MNNPFIGVLVVMALARLAFWWWRRVQEVPKASEPALPAPPSLVSTAIVYSYRPLSLPARLMVALRCVEDYCAVKALAAPSLTKFFDHLWTLPVTEFFPDWDTGDDELVAYGLGDPLPPEIPPLLLAAEIPEELFQKLISSTIEIVYCSAYGACNDPGSLQFLHQVFRLTLAEGVTPPPAGLFLDSLFADRHGWGHPISVQQRDQWRFAAYDGRVQEVPKAGDPALPTPANPVSRAIAQSYRPLSLAARLAVALRCVEDYCALKALAAPSLTKFFDHMWALPVNESFPDWEEDNEELVAFGLGDPLPPEISPLLLAAQIPEELFRDLISSTIEIIYGSAYGASDDPGSLKYLHKVLRVTAAEGVTPPPARLFLDSLFADRHGWGRPISLEQRDRWRFAAYEEK